MAHLRYLLLYVSVWILLDQCVEYTTTESLYIFHNLDSEEDVEEESEEGDSADDSHLDGEEQEDDGEEGDEKEDGKTDS